MKGKDENMKTKYVNTLKTEKNRQMQQIFVNVHILC